MKRIYNGISIKYVQEPAEKQTMQLVQFWFRYTCKYNL